MTQPAANPKLEAFKAQMIEQHESLLRPSMELVRIANDLFNKEIADPLHKVIRAIARIAVNSNGAALTLATAGYGNDAAKIVRSQFEGAITIAYLRLKPNLLQDYFDFYAIKRWQYYLFTLKEDPDAIKHLVPEKVDEMKKEYDAVLPKFQNKGGYVRTSWCKVSVRDRAEVVGLGKYYPMFYAQASGMHHFDAGGLASRASEQALDVEVAPSERWVEQSLLLGFIFTFRALFDFNQEATLGFEDALETVHNSYFGPPQ